MIGIVMIPLAASCVFAAGAYSQRLNLETSQNQRNVVEVRAIYVDRRGSDAVEEAAASSSEADEQTARLHSPGGPQAALPATATVCGPLPFSLGIQTDSPRPRQHVWSRAITVRGPPDEA
jgi:hypothetical protein